MNFKELRDKYGFIIMILSYITILLLFIFVIIYGKELSTNPLSYIGEKYNIDTCMSFENKIMYYINESGVYVSRLDFG